MSDKARAYHLKTKYGITVGQYERLLEVQGGCCAVCQKNALVFKTRLAVDHNHKTGEIRGLLCYRCNKFVIGRNTDPSIFQSAAAYLRQCTEWIVPLKVKKKKRRKRKKRNATSAKR